jgi:hypothetical protein
VALLAFSFSRNCWECVYTTQPADAFLTIVHRTKNCVPTSTRVYYVSHKHEEHPSIRRHTPRAQVLLLPHTRTLSLISIFSSTIWAVAGIEIFGLTSTPPTAVPTTD